jgi:hypothetical protein
LLVDTLNGTLYLNICRLILICDKNVASVKK